MFYETEVSVMRKFILSNLYLVLSIVLTACNNDATTDNSQQIDDNSAPKVALIMKSLANEFFVTMSEGATAHQQKNSDKYQLITNGLKDESDLAQQVVLIDQMIAAGVDAMVIAPADSKAIVPALARARDVGIIIVNIDNRLDESVLSEYQLNIPFVGPDNREGARKVAETLASKLSAGSEVAILEGVPTAFNSQQRRAGFEDAINASQLNIVTVQSAAWDQTKAVSLTSALLVKHPELKAIFCANDNMALGAISALTQAGKQDNIQVVGFDNISAAYDLVKNGKMFATADQHAGLLAVYGIEFALEALANPEQKLADKQTPVDVITHESLSDAN